MNLGVCFKGTLLFLGIVMGLPGVSFCLEEESLVLTLESDGVQRATLIMESYTYSPSHLIVQAGSPVELTLQNESFLVPHNFILDDPSSGVHIEQEVDSGESVTVRVTLSQPGVYAFYCDKQLFFFPTHREEGMEGRIEVR